MRRCLPALLFLLLILLPGVRAGAADRIVLKTGSVLTGRIVAEDEKSLTIEIEGLGKLVVLRSKIASLEGGGKKTKPGPPVRVVPAPKPAEKSGAATSVSGAKSGPPAREPVDIPWDEVKAGQTALLIGRGEDHGEWRDPGRRILGRVDVVGPKRLKIETDREAGVLGFVWLPRNRIRRIIRVAGYPERRFFFFEGIETGSWIEGKRGKSRFAGRLASVSQDGTVTILCPDGDKARTVDLPLEEITTLTAVVRGKSLSDALSGLIPGEPVSLRVRGRDAPIRGLVRERGRAWLGLTVPGEDGGEPRGEQVYLGLPITQVDVLPEAMRPAFRDARIGDVFTAVTVKEEAKAVVRRSYAGRLRDATTEEIVLDTCRGVERLPVSEIHHVRRTDPAKVEALMKERDRSSAESVLAVLPGMSRTEAEKRLPGEHPGIDILYDGDRVRRVYCRSPFKGPVFGIRMGETVAEALRDSDLDFDTQIDPKSGDPTAVTRMISRSLRGLTVRLFVTPTGTVLAAEVSAR